VQSTATCRAGLEQAARSILARPATDSRSRNGGREFFIFISNYLPISLNIVVQILANVDAMVFAHTIFDYHNKPWEVLHRLGHPLKNEALSKF
jgi:hypothetical protein